MWTVTEPDVDQKCQTEQIGGEDLNLQILVLLETWFYCDNFGSDVEPAALTPLLL